MRVPQLDQVPVPKPSRAGYQFYGKGEPRKYFLKIPQQYFDLIKTNKLGGSIQRDVVMIIMRLSWGVEGRLEWAPLTLTALVEECGGVSKGSLHMELQDLKERGLIDIKDSDGCKSELKLYKVTVDRWKDAKPYEKKDDLRSVCAQPATSGDRVIVEAGGKPTFVPARLALPEREPVDFRISYVSSCARPMAVSSSISDDVVLIHFADPEKANEKQTSILDQERKTGSFIDNTRLKSITVVTQKLFISQFGKAFDPDLPRAGNDRKFLKQILKAAGPAMPAEYFESFAITEIRAMVRKRKPIFPGILIPLAAQAAQQFAAQPEASTQPTQPPAPPPPPTPFDESIPWDKVRKQLQAICSPENYENWFAYTRQISAGKTSIVVAVRDEHVKSFLEEDGDLKERISEACAYTQQPSKIIWKVQP